MSDKHTRPDHVPRSPGGGPVTDCDDDSNCRHVSCEVCLGDLPADAVNVTDAQDYVHHFCGLGCLERWRKQSAAGASEAPEKTPDRLK